MTEQERNVDIAIFMGEKRYKNFHYHESWDELIPVIAKINSMNTAISPLQLTTMNYYAQTNDIEKAHKAVYEWIKVYNNEH